MFFYGIAAFAQNVSTVTTQYSKTGNGGIGKENYSFSILNGVITITDLDKHGSDSHDPLKLDASGFDERGWYYEKYVSDIRKDPARWIRERKKSRARS